MNEIYFSVNQSHSGSNVISHWPLEACMGGNDVTGSGHNLTLLDLEEKPWPGVALTSAGCSKKYLYYDGTSGPQAMVSITDSEPTYSFTFLLKMFATCDYCPLVEILDDDDGAAVTTRFMVWIASLRSISVSMRNSNNYGEEFYDYSSTLVHKTLWLSFSYDHRNGRTTVFLNETKLDDDKIKEFKIYPWRIYIGKRSLNDQHQQYKFKGFIQNIQIHAGVLSDGQIVQKFRELDEQGKVKGQLSCSY